VAAWRTEPGRTQRLVAELRQRDGTACWLCDREIPDRPRKAGKRISIEHLVARSRGGGDELDNLVLCHDACNRHLADRPLEQKRLIRAKWHRNQARIPGRLNG
jgi:5-methylcytosine-specific restriction endonuclease McrA